MGRESAQALFDGLAERLHAALTHPSAPLAQIFSARALLAMYERTREAAAQCRANVAPAHTAAWLAERLWAGTA